MQTQKLIPIDQIVPNPYQPRDAEDPAVVAEIAESIQHNGLMQVPSARQVNGHYELAFGHTRWAAFKLLKESSMPLIVRELTDLQMFELGVAENIKRRDLNPIEQAKAMQRYMQEFKKNSVETGEFFGVSAEQVRSSIRLLNLPASLQKDVADGTVNITNARRLLTIQRVAPENVEKVAKKLIGDADADQVISEALTNTGKSVEMWQRWQGGEPQAGRGLWQLRLSAESFPKKELPALKAADVARSLDIKLTGEKRILIDQIIFSIQQNPDKDISILIEKFPDESLLIERIAHLLNPPSCTTCPFYAKVNGSHYCTFRTCHTRKAHAYEKNKIKTASKKLEIKIYDPKVDGKDTACLSSYDEQDKKLVKSHNADLRLKKGTNWSQHFDGVPEGYSIIVIGATLKKMRKAASDHRDSRDQSHTDYLAEQRRLSAIREARRLAVYEFLWNVATPALQPVLSGVTSLDFVEQFADRMVRGVPAEEPDKKAKKDVKLDFYRRAILFSLLDDDLWDIYQKNKPVMALAKHLQGVATTWGVKLPKNWLALAADADKGIKLPAAEEGKPA